MTQPGSATYILHERPVKLALQARYSLQTMNPKLFDLPFASGHSWPPLPRSAPIPPFTNIPHVPPPTCVRSAGDGADRADADGAEASVQTSSFRTLIFIYSDSHSLTERASILRRSPTPTVKIWTSRDSHALPKARKHLYPEMKKPSKTSMFSRAFFGCGGSQPPRPTFSQDFRLNRLNLLIWRKES